MREDGVILRRSPLSLRELPPDLQDLKQSWNIFEGILIVYPKLARVVKKQYG